MNCTQKQQLVCFPKVRVYKPWFRHFNDHKDFRNEGTVHLFSLMALFSYANFRSNERVIYGDRYQCDLLMLSDIHPMPEGFRGSPIMLCFDYQTQVIQRIVGPAIEVRPLESRLDYG